MPFRRPKGVCRIEADRLHKESTVLSRLWEFSVGSVCVCTIVYYDGSSTVYILTKIVQIKQCTTLVRSVDDA